jgi:hypothetical protein
MNNKILFIIMLISINYLVSYAGINANFAYYLGGSSYWESSNLTDSLKFNGSNDGFAAGILIEMELNRFISIEPGIGYSGRGSAAAPPGLNITNDKEARHYFVLPLNAKFTLDEAITCSKFSFYLLSGFNLGFLISADSTYDALSIGLGGGSMTQRDKNVTDKYKSIDLGINFGGGPSINWKFISLFLEYRYYIGLTNIAKAINVNIFNRGSEIIFGMKLHKDRVRVNDKD